ncbi:hypothetical protein T492DRAFT_831882 [Pavlovales sp. CCMP2436]|nr:hypothetical protein T492DRAFT_831882 [Pavlovales sp. CCMP2436]
MEALSALEDFAGGTRAADEAALSAATAAGKRARTDTFADQARATREEVAGALAAGDEAGDEETLDETTMKRLVLSFEKRVTENVIDLLSELTDTDLVTEVTGAWSW